MVAVRPMTLQRWPGVTLERVPEGKTCGKTGGTATSVGQPLTPPFCNSWPAGFFAEAWILRRRDCCGSLRLLRSALVFFERVGQGNFKYRVPSVGNRNASNAVFQVPLSAPNVCIHAMYPTVASSMGMSLAELDVVCSISFVLFLVAFALPYQGCVACFS